MSLRRIAIIATCLIAVGGGVAIANSSSLFSSLGRSQSFPLQARRDRDGWLKELNLSAQQLRQIQTIRQRFKAQYSSQRETLHQRYQELQTLMASDASKEQILQKYSELRPVQQQVDDARFQNLLEVRDVLTLEQRRKFAEHMQKKREKFKDRLPDGSDGPGGMNRPAPPF
jgi:Spy/CpxP family protein refolding chaperone